MVPSIKKNDSSECRKIMQMIYSFDSQQYFLWNVEVTIEKCLKLMRAWIEGLRCFFLPGAIKLQDLPLAVPCPYWPVWPVLTVLVPVLSEP